MQASMRVLTLLAALFLLTGEGVSQVPFTGQIMGTVVTGTKALRGVTWIVEAHGQLLSGEADTAGRFTIDLPTLVPSWDPQAEAQLAVSFTKPGYEQVIHILDCRSAGQSGCHDLNVTLLLLPDRRSGDTAVALDLDEIDTLETYYSSTSLTLYLLPPDVPVAAGEDITMVMLESIQDTITRHLQTLPVRPPPQNITPPSTITFESLSEVQVMRPNPEKMQHYGRFLNALAMIGVRSIRRDASGSSMAHVEFHYQTIPFHEAFQPVREIVSYILPAEELSFDDIYEKVSARWGFYTLLALSVREVSAFSAIHFFPAKW